MAHVMSHKATNPDEVFLIHIEDMALPRVCIDPLVAEEAEKYRDVEVTIVDW